ncbi:hypothetical protein GQ54DRAFT_312758 [Martensiomyces pterosporus]|nr:hypothetical protein GQ54DRAFT_312758 [Martensiomyces pterosporus]
MSNSASGTDPLAKAIERLLEHQTEQSSKLFQKIDDFQNRQEKRDKELLDLQTRQEKRDKELLELQKDQCRRQEERDKKLEKAFQSIERQTTAIQKLHQQQNAAFNRFVSSIQAQGHANSPVSTSTRGGNVTTGTLIDSTPWAKQRATGSATQEIYGKLGNTLVGSLSDYSLENISSAIGASLPDIGDVGDESSLIYGMLTTFKTLYSKKGPDRNLADESSNSGLYSEQAVQTGMQLLLDSIVATLKKRESMFYVAVHALLMAFITRPDDTTKRTWDPSTPMEQLLDLRLIGTRDESSFMTSMENALCPVL